jgi:hypothetical protein
MRGGKTPQDLTSNMAEAFATLPSSLIATDCPNVVTVTTRLLRSKVSIIIGLFIIIIARSNSFCDSSIFFIYHFLKGACHTELLVENEILKNSKSQQTQLVAG